ncbi:MAG: glycosyltransferase family 39 protein [Saprospiraceae bacterium]|nr:glycosyltransferase family 39 protein [Saprospiraceae bacterium]
MRIIRTRRINDHTFFILSLLISLPILLINLGAVPFIEDEGIRSLVALEMDHSGNWITPTLYGEYYYKKPPLWNWILLLSYRITGVANEFTTRLPVIFFLYLFTISIYITYKRYLNTRMSALTALLFLTCGRILFWDSMLGLIDIAFSWVVFLFFFWIFHFHRKDKLLILYLGGYVLVAIAFLLKALPALVFLAFTLIASHLYFRSWKNLLTWQHLAGILSFGLIIGTYLFLFSKYQPVEKLLQVFVSESTRRTVLEHGIGDSILQIVKFPFEMVYHFLPWSALSVMLLHKNAWKYLQENSFISYTGLIFLANIWIYWTSPEVYPRYLLMFIPLYLGGCLYLYDAQKDSTLHKVADILLIILAGGVLVGSSLVLMNHNTRQIPGVVWKWLLAAIPMTLAVIVMVRYRHLRIHGFIVFLIAARFGFSLIVLPSRAEYSAGVPTRTDAYRIAAMTEGHDLYIYNHDTLRYEAGFYLTAARGKTLTTTKQLHDEAFMLMNRVNYSTLADKYQAIDSIRVRRQEKYVYLIKGSKIK